MTMIYKTLHRNQQTEKHEQKNDNDLQDLTEARTHDLSHYVLWYDLTGVRTHDLSHYVFWFDLTGARTHDISHYVFWYDLTGLEPMIYHTMCFGLT